jgi:hypothetical protein
VATGPSEPRLLPSRTNASGDAFLSYGDTASVVFHTEGDIRTRAVGASLSEYITNGAQAARTFCARRLPRARVSAVT